MNTRRLVAGFVGLGLLTVALLLMFHFTLEKRDALSGDSLRCGTAAHKDNESAKEYQGRQIARAIDRQSLTEPPLQLENPPQFRSQNLLLECDQARSSRRLVGLLLAGTGVALGVFSLFGWRWLTKIGAGAKAPHWMREAPEWVATALTAAVGVAGVFVGVYAGWARFAWLVGMVLLIIASLALVIVREYTRGALSKKTNDAIEKLKTDHHDLLDKLRENQQNLLGNQLTNLIQLVAEAVAEPDVQSRRERTSGARGAIIQATASLVGLATAAGTVRANLFQLSCDGAAMTLAPGGFAGRGTRSRRTFCAGDRTFDLCMEERSRFVHSTHDDLPGDESARLLYETFLTYPVAIGSDRIYGVLTVDSPRTGDLNEADDRPMMALLAALIAVTYECEKFPNPGDLSVS